MNSSQSQTSCQFIISWLLLQARQPLPKLSIHSIVVNQLTAVSRLSGVIRFPPSSDLWKIDLSSRGRTSIAVRNDTPYIGSSSFHVKDTESESRMPTTHQTRGIVGFFRRAVATLANVSALV